MPSLKPIVNWLRARLPAGLAYAEGVLMALSVSLPVAVGVLTGHTDHLRMIAYGAFQVGLVNVDGLYRDRARIMLTHVMLLVAMLLWVNLIHGDLAIQALSTFLVMLAAGQSAALGPAAASLSLACAVAYIVNDALFSNLGWGPPLLHACLSVAGGGLWAVFLRYLWSILRPRTVLAQKVGEIYFSLAGAARWTEGKQGETWSPQSIQWMETIDASLHSARALWASARSRRHGASPRHLQLLAMIEAADRLEEELALAWETQSHLSSQAAVIPCRPYLEKAWEELEAALRAVPSALSSRHTPLRLIALGDAVATLDEQREALRQAHLKSGPANHDPLTMDSLVALRGLVEGFERMIEELDGAGQVAVALIPRAFWERFWQGTPVADLTLSRRQGKLLGLKSMRSIRVMTALDRHAFRYAGIIMLGAAVGKLPLFHHGYWVPLHIAIVLKPDYGSTAERSLERTTGTVFGSLLGMGLVWLSPPNAVLWSVMLVLLGAAITVRPVRYAWFVALITPAVILLISLTAHGDWAVGLDRILSSVAGVGLALLGVGLLFPRWERGGLADVLARAIHSHLALFDRVARGYLDPATAPAAGRSGRLRYQATLDVANLHAAARRMLKEPAHLRWPHEVTMGLVAQLHRLVNSIAALAYYQGQYGGRYENAEFAGFSAAVRLTLEELELSVRERRQPSSDPDLGAALEPLQAKVRELQRERAVEYQNHPESDTDLARAVREQTPVLTQLERIVDELEAMRLSITAIPAPRRRR